MEHERTIEEIKSIARRKAKAQSVTAMTILFILIVAAKHLERGQMDSTEFVMYIVIALLVGLLIFLKAKYEIELDELEQREIIYEQVNLSQVKDVLIEPLELSKRFSELKEEGAKFYARLTFGNNICILVKFKDGKIQNYSWLKKGRFRENYKIVSS